MPDTPHTDEAEPTRESAETEGDEQSGNLLSRRRTLTGLLGLGVLGTGTGPARGGESTEQVRHRTEWTVTVDGDEQLRVTGADSFVTDGREYVGSGNVRFGHLNSVESGVVGGTVSGGGLFSTDLDRAGGNTVSSHFGTVGGGALNRAGDASAGGGSFATVAGGLDNTATGSRATVAGGRGNDATGRRATVGGGNNNNAMGTTTTVAGGLGNDAEGEQATVGGGGGNAATGDSATVAGGRINGATARNATVAGGRANRASATGATVPGGSDNVADGDHSFAAGRGADARGHDGAVLFADSTETPLTADADDTAFFQMPVYARSFNTTSTHTAKTAIDPVDTEEILAGVESLDVRRWRFRDGEKRHVGPMAEEFAETFGVGSDESIATVDADGVAFAAIQALAERVDHTDDRIEALERRADRRADRVAELEGELDAATDRIAALERRLDELSDLERRVDALEGKR